MFRVLTINRIDSVELGTKEQERLEHLSAKKPLSSQMTSYGWCPVASGLGASLVRGEEYLHRMAVYDRVIPTDVVKETLNDRCEELFVQTGKKVKGKKRTELKEEIIKEMLPNAFISRRYVWVWVSGSIELAFIGSANSKDIERARILIQETYKTKTETAHIKESLEDRMTAIVASNEAPNIFSLGGDVEMYYPDSDKPTVRFARHDLSCESVALHTKEGKRVRTLSLYGDMGDTGIVSFNLNNLFQLRKIHLGGEIEAAIKEAEQERPDWALEEKFAICKDVFSELTEELINGFIAVA